MMIMFELRSRTQVEEFDHLLLLDVLKDYRKPRNKITQLLKAGDIVRVKKGIYVFGDKWRKSFVCKESLANLIYGPSYISLEYALSYYGLIPERVECLTSVTTGRNKTFDTPFGRFSYQHLNHERYSVSVDYRKIDDYHEAIIATPEKALADFLATKKDLTSIKSLSVYLVENMRMERDDLRALNPKELSYIADNYRNRRVSLLYKAIGGGYV